MKNTIITSLLLLSLVLTTVPAAEAQSQSKQSAVAARRAQIEARREARRHRENADDEYTRFRENARQEYSNFRQKANQEYADFLRKAWEEFRTVKGEPIPDKDVKPLPIIEYEKKYDEKKEAPIENRRLPIKEQVVIPAPEPKPQPKPVEPIKEVPVPAPTYFDFDLYSTPLRVRDFEKFRGRRLECTFGQQLQQPYRRLPQNTRRAQSVRLGLLRHGACPVGKTLRCRK